MKQIKTQDHHQIFLWERKFISSIREIKTKLDETTHHKTGNITSAHTGWEGREILFVYYTDKIVRASRNYNAI